MEKENKRVIPFVKPERVGNFKLWRGRYALKSGREKAEIECLHVSNLDGSWMIRIPATMQMFSTIVQGFAVEDDRKREEFLGMLFSNQYNVTTNASEDVQYAMWLVTEMLTYPYLLLPEKEMVKRMKARMKESGIDKSAIEEHVGKMVEHRKALYELIERRKNAYLEEYERQMDERRAMEQEAERQTDRDELAEKAMDIVNEGT